jgi:plastocyanin
MTMLRRLLPSLVLMMIALVTFASACSSGPATPPPAKGGGKRVDAATAGTLSGRVVFEGAPPPAEVVKMGTDKACITGAGPNPQSDAVLIGANQGLQNVFVHIKSGIDSDYSFDVPAEPVAMDQQGCVYKPRVVGVRTGQPLKVLNSDETMHNVHAIPMANQEFNQSTMVRGSSVTKTFTVAEVPVRFVCNVHNWMAAWVGVVDHPFFAVTDATGAFSIAGVPPGTYTVEAWHEKFGVRTQTITIGEKQNGSLSFSFAPTQ